MSVLFFFLARAFRSGRNSLSFSLVWALCGVLAAIAPGAYGQLPGDADGLVRAHLAAGEFAPARALADRAGDPRQRDAWLGQIAAAQARAGARRASLNTAADIADDVVRSNALQGIGSQPIGGGLSRGGASQADFETLINLITSTVAPTTWVDAGGAGAVDGFPGGVFVDAAGVLRRIVATGPDARLSAIRTLSATRGGNGDVRTRSALRKVSLTRLEKRVQVRWAAGREPDDAMRTLAGLQKVKYVLVYPDTGDVVLAGPAGDWKTDAKARMVSVDTGRPVLRLDDLVVLLRNAYGEEGRFGCSITPTKERLAATKAFLAASSDRPLTPATRPRWLKQIRDHVGKQKIEVYGIDPRTRAARVIVEADYRMKLVGMGLERGTMDVPSYLSRIKAPKPMDVLRWWFTLNYKAVHATKDRCAFEIRGQGVKVLSQNELITERGERVHTGKSDELNREFARDFTMHFAALAAKYPIYAELQNIFDLALVAAMIRAEDLPGRVGWHLTHFGPPDKYEVELGPAPKEVETVISHRVIGQTVVAFVSGGVTVRTKPLVQPGAVKLDTYGLLQADHSAGAPPEDLPRDAWWWD